MANQNVNSNNIDDFNDFDFRALNDNDTIEVSEQDHRSFPLSIITQRNGILNVNVIIEVYRWDYWLRNYSINKFKSAFENSFSDLHIAGISEVIFQEVTEEEGNEYILLSWNLKFPTPHFSKEIKTKILNSVDVILYKTRIQLEENENINLPKGLKRLFLINGSTYHIGVGTFWVALPIICGFAFFLGTVKYDADKISLFEKSRALEDSIKFRDIVIRDLKNDSDSALKSRDLFIRNLKNNSDSALNILGHMPYNEMKLDTQAFRKVQTTIENAGAALYLNK